MSPSERVAVVIPCFNDGQYLTDALESLRDQEPCEVVVVDDGSTDPATLELLDRVEDERVRVIHQVNAGLAAARMAGVRATSAPYLHVLDADDRLAPGALETLADVLDADPNVHAAWGDLETFGAVRRRVPKRVPLDPWRVSYLNEAPAGAMFRRTALEQTGGWTLKDIFEDWDLWMRFASEGLGTVAVGPVTYLYREHTSPRMYTGGLVRKDEVHAILRARNAKLYEQRRANRRGSPAPRSLKLLFPVIERIPFASAAQKEMLMVLARNRAEPQMRPSDFPTAGQLFRARLTAALRWRPR
jgi:glycosyltransferase involved in cell wall biosynthesis